MIGKYKVPIEHGCWRRRNAAWVAKRFGMIIALLLHGCGHTGDTFYFAWNKALNKETLPTFRTVGIISIYDPSENMGLPRLFGTPDVFKRIAEVVRQADLGPEIGELFAQHVGPVLKIPIVHIADLDGLFKNKELDKSALAKRYDVDAVVVINTLSFISPEFVYDYDQREQVFFLIGKFITQGRLINLSNDETLWSKKHHYPPDPPPVVWVFRRGPTLNVETLKSRILPYVTSLVEWLIEDIRK